MNWRAMLLSGTLVAGLGLATAPRASADPPPWAGKWNHQQERTWNGHGYRDRGHWHQVAWDRDDGRRWQEWRRNEWTRQYDRPNYGGYRNDRRYDPNYAKMMDRIHFDRTQINEIEPTGRHRKALQWYKDDLRNAERYLHDNHYAGR